MNRLLLIALICIPAAALTQTTPDLPLPPTKLETLMTRTGSVIVRNYNEIGTMRGGGGIVTVEAVQVIDLSSNQREYGLSITVTTSESPERDASAFIDYDEIDPSIRAMEYISKLQSGSAKLPNFDSHYTTRDGVTFALFNRVNGDLSGAIALEGRRPVHVSFHLQNFARIREIMGNAKLTIDSVRGV